jgi:hypothetical protein
MSKRDAKKQGLKMRVNLYGSSFDWVMRVWEMSLRRYSGLAFTSAAIVLGGYGIMILVTPTQEQIKAVPSSNKEC